MPVKVIKYTCAFKCGTRAEGKFVNVVKHESKCTKNPETKSCRTCSNEIYEYDGDFGYSRKCKLSVMDDWIDNNFELLKCGNGLHMKPIVHCPNHNLHSTIPELTEMFLDDIKKKLVASKNKLLSNDKFPF